MVAAAPIRRQPGFFPAANRRQAKNEFCPVWRLSAPIKLKHAVMLSAAKHLRLLFPNFRIGGHSTRMRNLPVGKRD